MFKMCNGNLMNKINNLKIKYVTYIFYMKDIFKELCDIHMSL